MTAPGANPPEGAYVIGSKFSRDITRESVLPTITGAARIKYNAAAGEFGGIKDNLAELADTVRDGQADMGNRLDLLESVSGYQSLFMGNSWNVLGGKWVTLPFDEQLGPSKGAEKFLNGIRFKSKGLWRSDAHVTFAPAPADWGGGATPAAVLVEVKQVGDNKTFTAHEYDIVITQLGAETAAFSHTFVIPADDAYYVTVSVYHPKNSATVYGGTLRSALSVNRWDLGTDNPVVKPTVPNGGTLG
ncbi:hypothetical protein [Nocardia brasiliensis]|uniref:hypothetical protein n=1 Tax=Nocardia brasiliensis TaxID=37326 RepID=UPI003671E581